MADINSVLRIPDGNGNVRVIGGRDGRDGINGTNGQNGQGVPTGGLTGQILAKNSGTNYDTEWVDPDPGGSSNAPAQNQRLSIKTTPDYAGGPIALVGPNGTVSVTPGSQNAQAIADAIEAVYASGAVITGQGTSAPGVTGISNPDTAPTVANTGSFGTDYGSNFAGDFLFAYTYITASGETAPSPTTLVQVSDEGNRFLYTAPSLPSGATGTKWYSSRTARAVGAGGDTNLGFIGTSTGNTFTSTDSPVTGAASPPSTNSTGGPASLNITLDLGGTLAGTSPTPLSTTTAGVAIQVLQYGTAEGPGATLTALNLSLVGWQNAIAAITPASIKAEPALPTGLSTQYIRGDKTLATLSKASVGLDQVDNTSDATKQTANDARYARLSGGNVYAAVDTTRITDSTANANSTVRRYQHRSTTTPAAGFGLQSLWDLNSTTTPDQSAAGLSVVWSTATHASRTSAMYFSLVNNAGTLSERFRLLGPGGFDFKNSGGTSILSLDNTGVLSAAVSYRVGTTKVLGAQGAAIADADGSLADLTTKFNLLLARLRAHGIIAT